MQAEDHPFYWAKLDYLEEVAPTYLAQLLTEGQLDHFLRQAVELFEAAASRHPTRGPAARTAPARSGYPVEPPDQ